MKGATEVFKPGSTKNYWVFTGGLITPCSAHVALLLPSTQVLISGGFSSAPLKALKEAELGAVNG
jgi:hypothetical protein